MLYPAGHTGLCLYLSLVVLRFRLVRRCCASGYLCVSVLSCIAKRVVIRPLEASNWLLGLVV